jgi:hypothetical protein
MSYSVNEAAKLVGKNPRKIKLDIRQGKLQALRIGDKPNSAYRIEYKELRKTYSTSFDPQVTAVEGPAPAPMADTASAAAPKKTAKSKVALKEAADVALHGVMQRTVATGEDEMQILQSALAREIRNTRIMQKQLTDAAKLIERLLSGQVARAKTTIPPLALEPHMRPEAATAPATMDKLRSAVSPTSRVVGLEAEAKALISSVRAQEMAAAEEAESELLADDADDLDTAPTVDHIPVLSAVLVEKDEEESDTEDEAEPQVSKLAALKAKAGLAETDEDEEKADEGEVPVNDILKGYQARLDASIDMLRNIRTD